MKTKTVEVRGVVAKVLPNAMYKVVLDGTEKEVLCYLCGKLNKKFIKPDMKDSVMVQMSPTDLDRGRISKRF